MDNKYYKYKNKYIELINIINFLNNLLLEEKIKLCYKLYKNEIIYKLYIYIYNNDIYNINIKYNKIYKSKILYNLLNSIILNLNKFDSEYIKIAYIYPLQNIKKNILN